MNTAIVFLNTGDIFLYPYNSKRFTAETLGLWSDFFKMLPQYIHDYWYGLILFILFIIGLCISYNRIAKRNSKPEKFNYPIQVLLFIILIGLSFLGARGSAGRKPLLPVTVAKYVDIKKAPIATNSVFTLIHSFQKSTIKELNYFESNDVKKHFTLTRQYHQPTKKINVVVIILESFAKEFVGCLNNNNGYTPFIDSLAKNSLLCTNAYADAERSIKGVSAIIGGVPNLMDEDIQSSPYQMDCIPGLGRYLKPLGYHTSFFHGGTNGTMNFDVFAKEVGFDLYFGRSEFDDDKYFDGMWGIRDEEFFQYFASKLNTLPQPFCSVIFSVSSHHPYFIPEKYKNKFPKGNSEITESIGYADYSLKLFFDRISKESWFNNTLFVISADHSFPTTQSANFYSSTLGHYSIPILFYYNGKLKGTHDSIMQQHDLIPSILDFMGYNGSFNAFGNSVFSDASTHYAYFQISDLFYIFDDRYLLLFHDKDGSHGLYEYKTDLNLSNNIIQTLPKKKTELEIQIKAILQTHNKAVIKNQLCP